MTRNWKNIDHVMVVVRDLNEAKSHYERMGFYVTPLTHHPHGTANHLVMFGNTFIELLGVVDPEKLDERSRGAQAFLGVREGIAAIALPSQDSQADREALIARGLAPSDTYSFDRPVGLPNGREVRAIVDTVWASEPSSPLVLTFLSQQHVPEAIWVPEWQNHSNSAIRIVSSVMIADAPFDALETHMKKFLGVEPVDGRGGGRIFEMGEGDIQIFTPHEFVTTYGTAAEDMRPYVAGLTVEVADLEQLASCLDKGKVPFDRDEGGVRISPEFASGVLIEFRV